MRTVACRGPDVNPPVVKVARFFGRVIEVRIVSICKLFEKMSKQKFIIVERAKEKKKKKTSGCVGALEGKQFVSKAHEVGGARRGADGRADRGGDGRAGLVVNAAPSIRRYT